MSSLFHMMLRYDFPKTLSLEEGIRGCVGDFQRDTGASPTFGNISSRVANAPVIVDGVRFEPEKRLQAHEVDLGPVPERSTGGIAERPIAEGDQAL